MNMTRTAAVVAVPLALLLASCGGGSSGIVGGGGGTPGAQANVRFVQGSPTTGNVDIYFQSNGSAAPSSPLIGAVAYGVPTNFVTLPNVAGSVIVQNAGGGAPSTGVAQLASCPVPQFANNQNYSIVLVSTGGALNCAIYQDMVYTGSGNQYRFHNASPTEAATVSFGTATAPGAPGTSTFAVQGTTTFGPVVIGSSGATYNQITPTTLGTTSNVSYAVASTGATGSTATASNTLDAGNTLTPGTTTQPNLGNNTFTLPSGDPGVSVFDIACGAGAALPTGSTCVGGNALVAVFDSK